MLSRKRRDAADGRYSVRGSSSLVVVPFSGALRYAGEAVLGAQGTVDGVAQRLSDAALADRKNLRAALHEGLDDTAVPLAVSPLRQDLLDAAKRNGIAVRTPCAHGVVGIRNGEDARQERDVLACQAIGIALAIVALVV